MVGYTFTWLQEARRPDRWETVHGFYVGMGGLAFDLDNSFIRNEHKSSTFRAMLTASGVSFLAKCGRNKHKSGAFRATLTASGASLLAKCKLLPPVNVIAKDLISEKSKADDFAKFLVCVQAAWCFLQYIGRVAGHLPVTLLEVNTLGHALCAIAIYACWWKKPFDIKHPSIIESVPTNLSAYMWMCSSISCRTLDVRRRWEEFITWSSQDVGQTLMISPHRSSISTSIIGQWNCAKAEISPELAFISTILFSRNTTGASG